MSGFRIVAGYVLAVPTPRPPGHEDVLPPLFLTISSDIQEDLPQPEFWDWFVDRADAEQARRTQAPEVQIVTVSMTAGDADQLMDAEGGADQPWFDLLRRGLRTPEDIEQLGFEIVGVEPTLSFHSWHCYGCAPDARRDLGTRLNALGLIATYEEAAGVLRWMLARPPQHAVPPIPWIVVALGRS